MRGRGARAQGSSALCCNACCAGGGGAHAGGQPVAGAAAQHAARPHLGHLPCAVQVGRPAASLTLAPARKPAFCLRGVVCSMPCCGSLCIRRVALSACLTVCAHYRRLAAFVQVTVGFLLPALALAWWECCRFEKWQAEQQEQLAGSAERPELSRLGDDAPSTSRAAAAAAAALAATAATTAAAAAAGDSRAIEAGCSTSGGWEKACGELYVVLMRRMARAMRSMLTPMQAYLVAMSLWFVLCVVIS